MLRSVLIGTVCALLCFGCSDDKEKEVVHHVKHEEAPAVPPPPAATNPFEKPAPPPQYPTFQPPHWVQVGGEFKVNSDWSFWTWRDDANHNTCYLYNVMNNGGLVQSGMSCVRDF